MDRNKISTIIKETILLDGLNLKAMGFTIDDLDDSKLVFGDDGLGIDSVDVLEVILGIKKHFDIDLKNTDADFFYNNFATIGGMIDYIEKNIVK